MNLSLNGSQKTKSNSRSNDVSKNDLMMSTSVPIEIKSTKRIRYTFGSRKATNLENRLSSEQSPKENEQIGSNYNDKSMNKSLYLSSLTTENGFSNVKRTGLNRDQIEFTQSKSQKKTIG